MAPSVISPDWEQHGFFDPDSASADERRELLAFYESQGLSAAHFAGVDSSNISSIANRRSIRSGERVDAAAARAATGIDAELFDELIRVAGYPATGDHFTPIDIETLELFKYASEFFSQEEMLHFSAVMSSSLARIADAAASLFRIDVTPEIEAAGGSELDYAKKNFEIAALVKSMARPMWALFALQLEAASERGDRSREATANNADASVLQMGVGFVDLVGFTPLSEELGDGELATFIRGFEQDATGIVASHGGRLVKLIGDEVMFVAVEPNAIVQIACELMDSFSVRGVRPRGGVSHGALIARGGDYYGSVVNLASRIAELAVPGELLVDEPLSHLATNHRFEPAGRRQLKGFAEPVSLSSLIDT